MKVIIAGSRQGCIWSELLKAVSESGFQITQVVSGCAKGIDLQGEMWAKVNNVSIARFPADWDTHGKSAGYKRNAEMAAYADGLIALWDGESKGTKHMIDLAEKRGILIHVEFITKIYPPPPPPPYQPQ